MIHFEKHIRTAVTGFSAILLFAGIASATSRATLSTPDTIPAWRATGSGPLEQAIAIAPADSRPLPDLTGTQSHELDLLKKTPQGAFFRSLVLPGWGQRYAGRSIRGTVYTALDVGLWTGLILSRESWKAGENDYINFARQHANVIGEQSHEFYVDIGNFNSQTDFNEERRQRRQHESQYLNANEWWEWDTTPNRRAYKDLRITTDRHKNRVRFMIGGLLLNRVISAFDAMRALTKDQRAVKASSISIGYDSSVGGPALVWRGNLLR